MTPEPTLEPGTAPAEPATSRRAVLGGVAALGAVAAVGGLAACSGDDGGTGGDAGSPAAGDDAPPTGTLVRTSEVPVGGAAVVSVDSRKIIVTQPTEGEFRAFTAVCTHQACTVAGVRDGVIFCPCHGSEYDPATGEVVTGPNGMDPRVQAPLGAFDVVVEGDSVVLA